MTWVNLHDELAAEFSALQSDRIDGGVRVFNAQRKKYDAAEYRRRRALGICAHCSSKAAAGRATCERHRNPPGYMAPSRAAARVRLTAEQQTERAARIAGLFGDGWSLCRLSREFHVDRKTIRAQLRRMGATGARSGPTASSASNDRRPQ